MSRKPPTQEQQSNGRNEYIPSYISKAPFYAEGLSDGDYLEHQRLHATPKDTLDKAKWYERGRKVGPAATKYRKGACENCGAMTHKTKDCLSRPRKHGAKWTGKDIQADEAVDDIKLGWDAKRDRWNGYDAREYSAVVQEYEEMENLRKAAQSSKIGQNELLENGDGAAGSEDENVDSEARYAEETDMGRSQPTSTRQLRLREDTAKYLLNLDLDSAKYDPKTRSMDTTSQSLSGPDQSQTVADDGFVRPADVSNDAAAFERAQRYAWETQENSGQASVDVSSVSRNSAPSKKLHLQANPTEGEFLVKKHELEAKTKKEAQRKFLLDKYGDQGSHLVKSSSDLSSTGSGPASSAPKAITSSSSYVEYDKHGKPKQPAGYIKPLARSKYPEDIHPNNHTSIFGSWWHNFTWGYACCHSTVKNSYCTGEEGRVAFEQAEGLRTGQDLLPENESSVTTNNNISDTVEKSNGTIAIPTADKEQAERLQQEQTGEDIQERKDEANADTSSSLENKQPQQQQQSDPSQTRKINKRPFADTMASSIDEEEMEAYKRNKVAASDPMRNWGKMGEDGLLER